MHVLTVTTLYPNREQIRNGVFVRERMQQLVSASPDASVTVVAPVPWFPFRSALFGRYATYARVPREEQDGRIRVLHPRYLQIPKLGELLAPLTYFLAVKRCLARHEVGNVDLVDAHFAFPDGAGAVMLARSLGRPVSITVRGSDVNLIARERVAGRWIRWALARCDQVISVSEALATRVRSMLANKTLDGRVAVVRNGVDLERFSKLDGIPELRRELALSGRVVLSVGNLIALKGHDLVIEAIAEISDATLCVIGEGPEARALTRLARSLGISDRVRFVGEISQSELVRYYNAADATVLASSHEGLPNVVLESLACGTRVVATAVGGIPEVLTDPEMGTLLGERTAEAIRGAIVELSCKSECRASAARESVRDLDWSSAVQELNRIFAAMVRNFGIKSKPA